MSLTIHLSYLKRLDWLLLISTLLLILFGLATLYSTTINVAQPNLLIFNKQLIFFIVGFVFLLAVSSLDYRRLRIYSLLLYILSILLMVAVLFWGTTIRGTTGWFYFLGFGLQPVEVAKFVLVLALADIYAKRRGREGHWLTMILSILFTLIPTTLALLQPDFGSAAVLIGIGLGFFALINLNRKNVLFILIVLVLVSIFLWNFILLDYQQQRIINFVKPAQDPLGSGYHVRQSIIAVGSGQLTGRGLGLGTQSQLHFLPETATDFIFATIAESLGFLGIFLLIFFLSLLFVRILIIMKNARDNFSLYLVYGFGLIFFVQTVINIGMNIGLLPATGLSLPFVSYGGSFLIMCMLAIGVIQSVRLRQKIV